MSETYNYDTFRKQRMKEDMHFPGGPQPGQPAIDFDLTATGGTRLRLSDSFGRQPVLLIFGSIT